MLNVIFPQLRRLSFNYSSNRSFSSANADALMSLTRLDSSNFPHPKPPEFLLMVYHILLPFLILTLSSSHHLSLATAILKNSLSCSLLFHLIHSLSSLCDKILSNKIFNLFPLMLTSSPPIQMRGTEAVKKSSVHETKPRIPIIEILIFPWRILTDPQGANHGNSPGNHESPQSYGFNEPELAPGKTASLREGHRTGSAFPCGSQCKKVAFALSYLKRTSASVYLAGLKSCGGWSQGAVFQFLPPPFLHFISRPFIPPDPVNRSPPFFALKSISSLENSSPLRLASLITDSDPRLKVVMWGIFSIPKHRRAISSKAMATVFWFMTLFLHGLVFAHLVPDTITILNDRDFTEFTNFIPESYLTLTYSLDEPRKCLSNSNVQHGRVEIALSTVVPVDAKENTSRRRRTAHQSAKRHDFNQFRTRLAGGAHPSLFIFLLSSSSLNIFILLSIKNKSSNYHKNSLIENWDDALTKPPSLPSSKSIVSSSCLVHHSPWNLNCVHAFDMQQVPGSLCCYSILSPRVIQTIFDSQSLCRMQLSEFFFCSVREDTDVKLTHRKGKKLVDRLCKQFSPYYSNQLFEPYHWCKIMGTRDCDPKLPLYTQKKRRVRTNHSLITPTCRLIVLQENRNLHSKDTATTQGSYSCKLYLNKVRTKYS
ncbi:hypothetical protein VP01_3445g1 [Puccinia sorghi]|uniref:Uncharacterized protein n=1 Tax=Puccinia sorghi TaxID=27349 RepID=A0A0L6UW72_9BASI|nr:hypothetical protein VP01_3445g1 [Puccinia sorghi]